MKSALVIILFALVVVGSCEQEQQGGQQETLQRNVNVGNDPGLCWSWSCKQSCWAQGHKSGYCSFNACICVV